MLKRIVVLSLVVVIIGCSGYRINNEVMNKPIDRNAKFAVFPFEDPYFKGQQLAGVGSQFTRSFVSACEVNGLNAYPIENETFKSSKYISPNDAVKFAKENEYDYAVTGKVTKWIDRATAWSGRPDYLGMRIFVRDVSSGEIIYSADIDQHSSAFMSDTPDVFVDTLAEGAVKKMLGEKLENEYKPEDIESDSKDYGDI